MFVLLHLPTGQTFPETKGHYSWWKIGEKKHFPPRIFRTRQQAANALTSWLVGPWTTDWDEDGISVPYPIKNSKSKTHRHKADEFPARVKEEWSIQEIKIHFPGIRMDQYDDRIRIDI